MRTDHGLLALLIVIAAAGCHEGGSGGGATCDKVGARFLAIAEDDLARQGSDLAAGERAAVAGLVAPMRDSMVRACREDGWSRDARACFAGAPSEAAFRACEAKLSGEQRQLLERAAAEGIQPK